MNTAEIACQYHELEEDWALADTREARLHYVAEMNDNYRLIPDDAPLPGERILEP